MKLSWLRSFLWLGLALGLFGNSGGCSGNVDSNVVTETNWLTRCSADAECGAAHCLCGVCTTACGDDHGCAGYASGARCSATGSDSYAAQCSAAAPASQGLCLPVCDSAHPCLADALCIGGACTRSQSGDATLAAVGSACLPPDELTPDFAGYDAQELNVVAAPAVPACGAQGVCLVNHFQGRTSCPYGQTSSDLTLPADDPNRCRVPNADGSPSAAPVASAVLPELVSRQATEVVYCSCQCAGMPLFGSALCTCPTGMDCVGLVAGPIDTASYCVKPGTTYAPSDRQSAACDKTSTDPATDCGSGRKNP